MTTRQGAEPLDDGRNARPLVDLGRLWAGIRRRRALWLAFVLAGLLGGAAVALLAPAPPTAITRILVAHELDEPTDGGSLIRTDAELAMTTRIAGAALDRLGSTEPPERFLTEYTAVGLTNNVLELTVEGTTPAAATERASALAAAFVADHVGRTQEVANSEARALLAQRDRVAAELAGVNEQIASSEAGLAVSSNAATLDSLYASRAELTSRISDLRSQAEQAGIGAPRVAAGTQVVDAARPVPSSLLTGAGLVVVLGVALGALAGLSVVAVLAVVADRPVLRADIAANLGASVIAQLPSPRPWRPRAAAQRRSAAGALARLVRTDGTGGTGGTLSVLELGAPGLAADLTADLAERWAEQRRVVIVEDPPGRIDRAELDSERVRVVDVDESAREHGTGEVRLGLGSVAPGAVWTGLARLGDETVLVVRAGFATEAGLHTVARQLADLAVPVVGVVLVDPDPGDRSDGTLWDGLHTALRGRTVRAAPEAIANGNGSRGSGLDDGLPTVRFEPVRKG